MEILDLHSTSHNDANILIEEFIIKNASNLPVEIITGNSVDMQNILSGLIVKHNLRLTPSHFKNMGSYIITDKI